MATYCDDPVDNYFYSSYNPYIGRYHRAKDSSWRYKPYLSADGDASEAFSNQQRAQLKSILSQINPKLTPRLRKANTRDVAVQVNPRRDASVQCAIGPRTLQAMKRDFRRKNAQDGGQAGGGSPGSSVRYPRTLAVYSPVAFRSVTNFRVDENNNNNISGEQEQEGEEAGEPPGDPPATGVEGEESPDKQDEKSVKLPKEPLKSESRPQGGKGLKETAKGSKNKAPVRFQFLEQKYGYYHCKKCNLRWESAYVWCVQGTNKVYFKQYCRKCQKTFNPYRVEDITCSKCNKARCSCSVRTQRHVDPKRPHRQDLCGRCKGKRLSCESTFSFKYII